MTYQEYLNKTSDTFTKVVKLKKDNQTFIGIYKSSSCCGRVYKFTNNKDLQDGLEEVAFLITSWVDYETINYDSQESGYHPKFTEQNFIDVGYNIVN